MLTSLVFALLLGAAEPPVWAEPVWVLEGLANPESVILAPDGASLLVSNVSGAGDARDGDGFIARVGLDGRIVDGAWAVGLDAPKGMALVGDRLFVSDIDVVAELDARTGAVLARHRIEGAVLLNDVAAREDGTILVSDSGTGRIHALRDGAASLWLEDERLRSVNGLLVEPERVAVTTMRGLLLAVEADTRAVEVLAEELGAADGVAPLSGGRYLVTEWRGRLFEVGPGEPPRVLLDTREEGVLLNDILRVGDLLLVPNWEPGSLTAYSIQD